MQNFIREREKAIYIKKELEKNPDRITDIPRLKQDADFHVKDHFEAKVEDMALLLAERIVSQLAFVQAICGGTDLDLDTGRP